MRKKVLLPLSIFILSIMLIKMNNTAAYAREASPNGCQWELVDCPGWFSGSFEACLKGGDGYSCSCGDRTRGCD